VLSGINGTNLGNEIVDCLTVTYTEPACDDVDADGICDDVDDCVGAYDECGVCNGDGIADGACDCAGNVEDCAGECGGTAENCPDWVDCPSCYENTASMTAIVLDALSGDQMYADGDILAAFDDAGNNRGIAILLYPIPFGPYEGTGLYEIQIRGDAAGDAISFKYYDASEDEVLDSGTGYTFVIDDIIGDVVMPHEISVGAITLSIDIASGWNWFSLNVEGDMSIGSVMASLTSSDGDFIKSQNSSSTYYDDFGWYGGLEVMAPTEGYMLSVAEGSVLTYPNFGADDALTRAKVEKDMPIAVSDWEVNYHDYEFNGHITMSIDSREDFHGD